MRVGLGEGVAVGTGVDAPQLRAEGAGLVVAIEEEGEGVHLLHFTLPPGSYATVLLEEVCGLDTPWAGGRVGRLAQGRNGPDPPGIG